MSHSTITGIVIRYVNYKDCDRILSIFSRERGRVDAKARGCRRPKSPLLACSQPFVFGEFQLYTGKMHALVDQCDVKETFYPIREDFYRLAAASAMANISLQGVQAEEANEALFSLLYYSLSFLAYGENDTIDIMLCFLTRFFKTIGLSPAIIECAQCGTDLRRKRDIYFSAHSGGALCAHCGEGDMKVQPLTLEALRRILLLEDKEMEKVVLPHEVRSELFAIFERYLEYHLERENKSLHALRPLLAKDCINSR